MNSGNVHAVIAVANFDNMVRFYRDTLAMKIIYQSKDYVQFEECIVLRPKTQWHIKPYHVPNNVTICFYVSDILAIYSKLLTKGVYFAIPLQDYGYYYGLLLVDPEGNLIEMIQMHPHAVLTDESSLQNSRKFDTVIIGGLLPYDIPLGPDITTGSFENAYSDMVGRINQQYINLITTIFPSWGIPNQWVLRATDSVSIDNSYPLSEQPTLTHVTLKTTCQHAGFEVTTINIKDLFNPSPETMNILQQSKTISLSTTYVFNQRILNVLVEKVRQFNVPIIVGGPLFGSNESFEGLVGTVDYFVVGDGEWALPDILRELNGQPLSGKVHFQKEGKSTIVTMRSGTQALAAADKENQTPIILNKNKKRPPSSVGPNKQNFNLESYPTPDWSLVTLTDDTEPVIEYESVRGCSYRCEFCTYPFLFSDSGFRVKSAQRIFADWKHYAEELGIRKIFCLDSLFTIPHKRIRELCKLLIESKIGIHWNCFARVDDLAKDDIAQLMAEAGCRMVNVGFESGNQGILNNMNKRIKLEESYKAAENMKKYEIMLFSSFVVGFPGETEKTAQDTAEFIIDINPDSYSIFCMSYFSSCAKMPILEPAQRERYGLVLDESEVYIQNPSWKHDTMDWMTAMKLTEKMINEIGRSRCAGVYLDRFHPVLLQLVYSDLDYATCRKVITILRQAEKAIYTTDRNELARIGCEIYPYFVEGVPINKG